MDELRDGTITVQCDLCKSSATGTIKYLTDQGWVWAAFTHPERIMTRCPDHRNTLRGAVRKVLSAESDRLYNIFHK